MAPATSQSIRLFPKLQFVADLNLDQLRPIFPLKTLTVLALNESTLGDSVKKVAEPMGIKIQPDPEPERNLLRRSDHFSFMQIGVPAVNFVFGYEKGARTRRCIEPGMPSGIIARQMTYNSRGFLKPPQSSTPFTLHW